MNKAIGFTGLGFLVAFGIPTVVMAINANAIDWHLLPLGIATGFVAFVGATMFGFSFIKEEK